MRVLDMYCGAGLVADGLISAGWEVVGVDIAAQPRYPGPFIQMDVLALDRRFIRSFDAVWASPPCQFGTALRSAPGNRPHVNLIPATRRLLLDSGLPFVIENVESPAVRECMVEPVRLCGSNFGLGAEFGGVRYQLRRHRLFEANWGIVAPRCAHETPVIGVYGGHARVRAASAGGRGTLDFPGVEDKTALMRQAMGIERYVTGNECSQGIPPAFAEWIGRQLMRRAAKWERAAA